MDSFFQSRRVTGRCDPRTPKVASLIVTLHTPDESISAGQIRKALNAKPTMDVYDEDGFRLM